MKVCTAHDAHCWEVCGAEALLGIFFVSNFSAFLSEALLGLFCKHFFSAFLSPWLECGKLETVEIRRDAEDWKHWKKIRKCGKIRKIPIPVNCNFKIHKNYVGALILLLYLKLWFKQNSFMLQIYVYLIIVQICLDFFFFCKKYSGMNWSFGFHLYLNSCDFASKLFYCMYAYPVSHIITVFRITFWKQTRIKAFDDAYLE